MVSGLTTTANSEMFKEKLCWGVLGKKKIPTPLSRDLGGQPFGRARGSPPSQILIDLEVDAVDPEVGDAFAVDHAIALGLHVVDR